MSEELAQARLKAAILVTKMTKIIKFISKIPHVAARASLHEKNSKVINASGCGNLSRLSSSDCQESCYFLASYEILTSSYASLKK